MHSRLNILGSVVRPTDKNCVRNEMVSGFLRRDAVHWMQYFKMQLAMKGVPFSYNIVSKDADEIAALLPPDHKINLMVSFVNRIQPNLAPHIAKAIIDERFGVHVVLSHMPIEIANSWYHNFAVIPRSTSGPDDAVTEPEKELIGERLQIREMGSYRTRDMSQLIDLLVSKNPQK